MIRGRRKRGCEAVSVCGKRSISSKPRTVHPTCRCPLTPPCTCAYKSLLTPSHTVFTLEPQTYQETGAASVLTEYQTMSASS